MSVVYIPPLLIKVKMIMYTLKKFDAFFQYKWNVLVHVLLIIVIHKLKL